MQKNKVRKQFVLSPKLHSFRHFLRIWR